MMVTGVNWLTAKNDMALIPIENPTGTPMNRQRTRIMNSTAIMVYPPFIGAEVFNNICQEIQAHQDTSHRKGQIYHAHWDSDSGADILHGNSYDITAFTVRIARKSMHSKSEKLFTYLPARRAAGSQRR